MTADFDLSGWISRHEDELIAVRRHLHMHPELGRAEYATTAMLQTRLEDAGLLPRVLPNGTGLVVDIGRGSGPPVGLRADIDGLPLPDEKHVPYRSTVPGVSHACGHDVHTAALLGAGLAMSAMTDAGQLPGRVRLIFQPAEELTPGGALDVLAAGGLDGVRSVFALHCDPRVDIGMLAIRPGPITAAADHVEVHLSGAGGHTARPHLTGDVTYALGLVATAVPGLLSRRVDPRAGLSMVWGQLAAGAAANVIPQSGVARGTVRVLDHEVWLDAPELIRDLIHAVVDPTGVSVKVVYRRGVPPVVNDAGCAALLGRAAARVLGPGSVIPTEQSLGGEDFAWFLEHAPGALGRLGVRPPGAAPYDLHRGNFDVDELAIGLGAQVFVSIALAAMGEPAPASVAPPGLPRSAVGLLHGLDHFSDPPDEGR